MKSIKFLIAICLVLAGGIMLTKSAKPETAQVHLVSLDKAVKVKYKNYRGEVAVRSIIPMEVYWGQTEYHPHDQWLLKVWDVEKDAERIYAFKDIQEFDVQ